MKKRYWLRGGITGFLAPIIFIPFGYSPIGFITGFLLAPSVFLIQMISGNPSLEESGDGTIALVSNSTAYVFKLAAIISPIFWFIIGTLLGWLYGKIKKE